MGFTADLPVYVRMATRSQIYLDHHFPLGLHNDWLLQLVISGGGTVHLHDHAESFRLQAGRLLLHDPATSGYYVYDREDYVRMFMVRFGGPFADQWAQNLQQRLGRCHTLTPELFEECAACVGKMGRFDCEEHTPAQWGMPETLLSELFWLLDGKPDNRLRAPYQKMINTRTITMYFDEYGSQPFDLRHMAQHFSVSISTLTRKIKTLTNQTAVQLLNNWRITLAKRLLCQPDARIADICSVLGWSDRRQFTRVFSKTMGCSPKQYAMQKKNAPPIATEWNKT